MIYLLDTNICIYVLNKKTGYEGIIAKIDNLAHEQIVISSITLAELQYGIAKSVKKPANRIKLEYFLYQFKCMPFDEGATSSYGYLRTQLESKGTPIGPLDTLIAAHALALDAIVVTNNTGEFECVENLPVENWLSRVGGFSHD